MMTYWLKIAEKRTHSHLARSLGVTPCKLFNESYQERPCYAWLCTDKKWSYDN